MVNTGSPGETAGAPETLTIPSTKAGLVKLASVARLEPAQGPATIDRYGRQRQVVVVGNANGMALGDAVQLLEDYLKTIDLPPGYRHEFIGRAKLLKESNSNFVVAFGLIAMLTYPYLAHALLPTSETIGLFLGTAVHDTSQVVGSALTYKQVYGDDVVLRVAHNFEQLKGLLFNKTI